MIFVTFLKTLPKGQGMAPAPPKNVANEIKV